MIVDRIASFGTAPAYEGPEGALDAGALADEVAARARRLRDVPLVVCDGAAHRTHVLTVLAALEAEVPLLALHPRFPSAVCDALCADAARGLATWPEAAASSDAEDPRPRVAQLVPTSGSTGTPRAMAHTRAGIVAAAARSARALGIGPGARVGLGLPLGHVSGLSALVRTALAGGCLVVPDADGARRPVHHAVSSGVTHLSLVPTQLVRALDGAVLPTHELVRVVVGGAACDADVVRRAREAGLPVVRTYGMTETFAMVALEPLDGDGAGTPLDGVHIRLRAGRIGVHVDSLAVGVLRAGRIEALPRDPDGYFETPDVGTLDGHGMLRVLGRADDVILSGGENVFPAEVEAVLEAQPAVLAACVVGLDDAEWGQRVVALLDVEGPLDRARLDEALRARLPTFARPKSVLVGEVPRTASGKVDRAAVRRLLAERPQR